MYLYTYGYNFEQCTLYIVHCTLYIICSDRGRWQSKSIIYAYEMEVFKALFFKAKLTILCDCRFLNNINSFQQYICVLIISGDSMNIHGFDSNYFLTPFVGFGL